MKVSFINTFIFIKLMAAVLVFSPIAKAQDTPKQYKAKTETECVEEAECVWHLLVNHAYKAQTPTPIAKWKKPVHFRFFGGEENKIYARKFVEQISFLSPYFPEKVEIDKNTNAIVIFTDDFHKALTEDYYSTVSTGFTDELLKKIAEENKSVDCVTMKFTNPEDQQEVLASLTLIKTKSEILDYCIKTQAVSILGLGAPINFEFSVFDQSANPSYITNVDKFVLYLMYRPEFDGEVALSDIPDVFLGAYPKAVKSFLNQ